MLNIYLTFFFNGKFSKFSYELLRMRMSASSTTRFEVSKLVQTVSECKLNC